MQAIAATYLLLVSQSTSVSVHQQQSISSEIAALRHSYWVKKNFKAKRKNFVHNSCSDGDGGMNKFPFLLGTSTCNIWILCVCCGQGGGREWVQ